MRERSTQQIAVIFQSAAVLFGCAAAFGIARLQQLPTREPGSTLVVMALPISATLLFLLVAFLVPSLTATQRLAFPLNVTLPLVFGAMTVVSVVLWTTTGSALFQVPGVLRLAETWSHPFSLVVVAAAQGIALTLAGLITRSPR